MKKRDNNNYYLNKILVVEDYEGLRKLVQKELERYGFITYGVNSGKEAIKWIRNNNECLVIMDYKLPDISAEEVIKKLIDEEVNAHFIIMTGYGDIKVAVEMMKLGVKDYIIKDSNFLDLIPNAAKRVVNDLENEMKLTKAESALKSSEESYRLLAESVNDLIWKADLDLKFTYVSQSVIRMLGYSPEELLNVKIEKLLTKDSIRRLHEFYNKVIHKKEGNNHINSKSQMIELEQVKKSGATVWTEISVSLIYDSNKHVNGFMGVTRNITERKTAEKKIAQSFKDLRNLLEASIQAMGKATEIKDPYTAGHQRRVSILSYEISKRMNLPEEKCEGVRLAAAIHDFGKIYVPAEILSKPGILSENELCIIKSHPEVGFDILKTIDFPWPIAKIVLQHHERINGSGYPNGIKGDKISIEAKIISVADVVEAMASHRPYRPALGLKEAIKEIKKNKGILYDPKVVDICIEIITSVNFKFE